MFHSKIIDLVIKIVLMFFSAYVLINSVAPFAFIQFPMYSTAMTIPMQYVYFSLVLLFAFMVIAYLCEVLGVLLNWNEKGGK